MNNKSKADISVNIKYFVCFLEFINTISFTIYVK